MKILILIIAVGLIGGIGFVLFGNNAENTEVTDDVRTTESVIEETREESDEVSVIETPGEEEVSESISTDMEAEEVVEPESASVEHVFILDSFNYGYSETELRVKEGDTVTIQLTNSDGFHDWVVDEFGAATEKIQAGGNTSVTFVADKKGTFEYYCSVGAHRAQGMVGNLIVE